MIQFPLRAVRISCGYTKRELATYLQADMKTITEFEKDASIIPVKIISKFNKIFDIPLDLIYIGPEVECFKLNRKI